ncbi:MAG: hypothetical protein MUC59_09390 [Saprospiraceae bacterium]|nr:hypothetical protein [Saprospiraceae bacterium]
MVLNEDVERAYLFEHIWRQVTKKFYKKDLHGVDWDFYKKEYARFLPYLNNNYDFADVCSEMLGELNASHTGAFTGKSIPNPDQTAVLGCFYDENHKGNGLKIKEIIKKGPLANANSKVKAGTIIEKIDGEEIQANTNWHPMLNRKEGKNTLLSLYNETTKEPAAASWWTALVQAGSVMYTSGAWTTAATAPFTRTHLAATPTRKPSWWTPVSTEVAGSTTT